MLANQSGYHGPEEAEKRKYVARVSGVISNISSGV